MNTYNPASCRYSSQWRAENETKENASTSEKYQFLKKIVSDRQHGKMDGFIVDGVTANMLLQICDKLDPQAREKFLSLPISKMVDIGWKLATGKK